MSQDAPRADGAGGASLAPSERVVVRGYETEADARRYALKTRKGPLRRLSAWRERSLVLRSLRGLPAGGRVLDLPCGAGRLLPALRASNRCPVGADLAGPMLAIAGGVGAPLVRASAFALPFRDSAFAGVLSVRLLHHYREGDRARILGELRRVASDRVVVTVFDAASRKHRRRLRREKSRGRPSLRFGVDLAAFREELRAAGLRVRKVRFLLRGFAELTFFECERG